MPVKKRKKKASIIKSKKVILEKLSKNNIKLTGKTNIKDLNKRDKMVKEHRKKTKEFVKNLPKLEITGNILAIDMSKRKPGFCVMSKEGEIIEAMSYPGLTKHKPLEIILLVEDLIDKYNPTLAIFEATFSKFKRAAAVLSLYQGIVYTVLLKKGISICKIDNQRVKKEFGVRTKEKLFEKMMELYDLDLDFEEFNDEIDAIGIALTYLVDNDSVKKFD